MSSVIEINKDNFEDEVLGSDVPVLVDFWASWCGPCRAMHPVLEQLAVEASGKAKVCKVNVDENPELSVNFQVRSIPFFLVFKDGKPTESVAGQVDKSKLQKLVGL